MKKKNLRKYGIGGGVFPLHSSLSWARLSYGIISACVMLHYIR